MKLLLLHLVKRNILASFHLMSSYWDIYSTVEMDVLLQMWHTRALTTLEIWYAESNVIVAINLEIAAWTLKLYCSFYKALGVSSPKMR